MLSTLSFNANGEVVGGSTKFKPFSGIFADAASTNNEQQQQQQQDHKKATESAKDSLSTAQIDMLKGDLQDLEASIDHDNRSLLDHRGGNTTPCDGQAREGPPTDGGAAQPSQPILIGPSSGCAAVVSKASTKKQPQQQQHKKVLKGVLAQAKDKADDGVNPKWRVRLMTEADVEEVLRIQRLCYEPEYRELPESYLGRIRLYPQGNVVVEVPVAASNDEDNDSEGDSSDTDTDTDTDTDNDSDDTDVDNDEDVSNDCDEEVNDADSDDDDNDSDYADESPRQVKNQVTKYSPSGSPSASTDDLHSVKKRRVVVPAVATKWRMAGYIQAQPFLREGINDVNDLLDLERWLADHPTNELDLQRDVIYVHEIAMDPAFRGQGLTTPLTDYVQQLTADEGFAMITLVSLGPALGFWKRNGFILCRELDYGGHICYYMEKPLVDAAAAARDQHKPLADR